MAGESKANKQFDIDGLHKLLELMEQYDVREFKQQCGETRYFLRRGPQEVVSAAPVSYAPPPQPTATPAADSAPPVTPAVTPPADENLIPVVSPTVGTFYLASSPGEPAFVNVGDTVSPDTIVCIVEAMKLFNKIPAKVSGTIAKVLLADGDAVEYGQPMFMVKPN